MWQREQCIRCRVAPGVVAAVVVVGGSGGGGGSVVVGGGGGGFVVGVGGGGGADRAAAVTPHVLQHIWRSTASVPFTRALSKLRLPTMAFQRRRMMSSAVDGSFMPMAARVQGLSLVHVSAQLEPVSPLID